ncbi:hypothetical protein D4R71_00305, partial [bacterium]
MVAATVALIAAAGAVKAYGVYQEGKAQETMYNYQSALAMQQAAMTRRYAEMQQKALTERAEMQKRAITEAAIANITAEQAAAAEQARRLAGDIAELSGQQRATIGALGIGGVTAADIAVSTFDKSRLDQLAIRYNANVRSWMIAGGAKREAWALGEETRYGLWTLGEETKMKTWALKSEASQYRLAGKQAKRAAKIGVATTLLQTAASMASIGALRVPAAGGGG